MLAAMPEQASRRAIGEVWRRECGRLVATLTRLVRDVGTAEELAHDAFVAALERWPLDGIPANPGAWLVTTAKNRALNELRHARVKGRAHGELALLAEPALLAPEGTMDGEPTDDVLRLLFVACHPLVAKEARVALTLRVVSGLTIEEIARAFLAREETIAQRIVRAKRTLADAAVPFAVPTAAELGERLASVLEVVYLVYNEGYWATAGEDVLRHELCTEAMRLGALLATLAPAEPEAHALVALMQLQSARAGARVDARGEPVLLLDQDRTRWDADAIAAGLAALARADELAGELAGPYHLQARIAACHARATTAAQTDWRTIAATYTQLAAAVPSPVIGLNRAVAVGHAEGPAAGLALLDALRDEPALARYHLLPSARAEMLERLGRMGEAQEEFERAASLATNARQVARLKLRARACVRA
jgi:RNA polymerase sigma factor (sigma-70 family)